MWELTVLDSVDSTGEEIRRRMTGADEGLAVLAREQTAGRGRSGRSFLSPAGKGMYLSVLLRPDCPVRELLWLTAWAGVAVCGAVESVTGVRPGIKWPNDLWLDGRKLGGILTTLEPDGGVIVGVGINVDTAPEDLGGALTDTAVSLRQAGLAAEAQGLGRAVLAALETMRGQFPHAQKEYLARFRENCVTLGKPVRVLTPAGEWEGLAEGIDDDFALLVRRESGELAAVTAGEVSIRGVF